MGIDLGRERAPDATTLLKFRRLVEQHKLGESLFARVGQMLQARGLKVGAGNWARTGPESAQFCPSEIASGDRSRLLSEIEGLLVQRRLNFA